MLKTTEELLHSLLQSGAIPPNTVSGCSEREIEILEEAFAVKLPRGFKQFLRVMGKVQGSREGFFQEYYPFDLAQLASYLECREEAVQRLEQRNCQLTKTDFVFLASSNNCWCWFDTASGDEPPINFVMDDLDEPRFNEWDSFLAFLNHVAEEFLE